MLVHRTSGLAVRIHSNDIVNPVTDHQHPQATRPLMLLLLDDRKNIQLMTGPPKLTLFWQAFQRRNPHLLPFTGKDPYCGVVD